MELKESLEIVWQRLDKKFTNSREYWDQFIGKRFGNRTILEYSHKNKQSQYFYNSKCDCGNISPVQISKLIKGYFQTCKKCQNRQYIGLISGSHFSRFSRRARHKNMNFSITKEYVWELYLSQNKKCALSGVDIDFGDQSIPENQRIITASLDRINSDLGYIEGNVQWVHKEVNHLKSDFEQERFIDWCRKIVKTVDKKEDL